MPTSQANARAATPAWSALCLGGQERVPVTLDAARWAKLNESDPVPWREGPPKPARLLPEL